MGYGGPYRGAKMFEGVANLLGIPLDHMVWKFEFISASYLVSVPNVMGETLVENPALLLCIAAEASRKHTKFDETEPSYVDLAPKVKVSDIMFVMFGFVFAGYLMFIFRKLNFVVTQCLALAASPILRNALHPSKVTKDTRNSFIVFVGLFLLFFAFGRLTWYLIAFVTINYLLLRLLSPQVVQKASLFFSLTFLSVVHYNRLIYDNGSAALEITGPLMVMVQKSTSVAIFVHDGHRNREELSKSQQKNALSTTPSVLDYFSYLFQFHTLMAGPFVLYHDYQEFISGENLRKFVDAQHPTEPSPTRDVVFKVLISAACAGIYITVYPYFPISRLKDEVFFTMTMPQQIMYLIISTTTTRFKYYHAWILAEAICNSSGLGFGGYGLDGDPKWDKCNNVDMKTFELGSSMRECISAWNKGTNVWLRIVVYERVSRGNGVLLTFGLSALWHGFYPGYYLTFFTGALFTIASRSVRSSLRPHFLTTPAKKASYDFLTMLVTRVLLSYTTFSFVLLEFWPSVRVYWNLYFWLHFMALGAIFFLPRFLGQSEAPLRNRLSKLVEVTNSNGVNSLHG